MAWFELPDAMRPVCDLDDPRELAAQALRPSTVITRDYQVSRAWALRLFETGHWGGARWRSYHDSRWGSIGLWDRARIMHHGIEELTLDHPAIQEAAEVLRIRIDTARRR